MIESSGKRRPGHRDNDPDYYAALLDQADTDAAHDDETEPAEWVPDDTTFEVDNADETPRRLSLRWVTDVLDQPPPEPPVLIDGLLRAGELCVLGAPRAIGKSWFVLNLAKLLADGHGKLFGELDVQQSCRVLISQGELGEWSSWSRWKLLCGDGRPDNVAETFDRWRLRIAERRQTLRDSHDQPLTESWYDAIADPRLEATIAEHGFGCLIIDPWATYFAGRESSNDEAEAALDKLRHLANTYDLAVVIIHHLSKTTEAREPEDLWRGASRLADWASTRVTLLPHYKRETDWKKAGLTRQKARWHADVHFLRRNEPTNDFSILWDPTTGWWDRWEPPEKPIRDATDPTKARGLTTEQVADACTNAGGWPSLRAAADDLGVSPGTIGKHLERAVGHGLLETFDGPRGATGYRPTRDATVTPLFGDDTPADTYDAEPDPDTEPPEHR